MPDEDLEYHRHCTITSDEGKTQVRKWLDDNQNGVFTSQATGFLDAALDVYYDVAFSITREGKPEPILLHPQVTIPPWRPADDRLWVENIPRSELAKFGNLFLRYGKVSGSSTYGVPPWLFRGEESDGDVHAE